MSIAPDRAIFFISLAWASVNGGPHELFTEGKENPDLRLPRRRE